jgi:hypothetical protein
MQERAARPVLALGDWVHFDGGEHQVVALAGVSVRLRSAAGAESVMLSSHLQASPGFAVVDGEPLPELEPAGLLDGLPAEVLAPAREWERHIVEVITGLPPGAEPGAVMRPQYDPATRSLGERYQAKADELGVGYRTVEAKRARSHRPTRADALMIRLTSR